MARYHRPQSRVFLMGVDEVMTLDRLREAVSWHKRLVTETLKPLGDLYEVDGEIFHRPPRDDGKPDKRISAAHCKIVVDEFVGYFCGVPIKTTAGSEAVSEYLSFLERTTDTDERTSDLVQDACIYGRAYEMLFNREDGEVGAASVSPLSSFMVYDDSILQRPRFFVRYGVGADGVERGSFSDSSFVYFFFKTEDGEYLWDGEPTEHHFPGVPAVEYTLCKQRLGLYEPGVSLENAFNDALSEKGNDVASFADAYMEITGAPVEPGDIPAIKRNKIINFPGDGSGTLPRIGFLARPTADALEEHLLDRTEALFFRACQVPDLSDEHFGTASGQALKWRLLGMDNLAAAVKSKVTGALRRRYRLIFGNPISITHDVTADDWVGLSFHFTRNLPSNVSDEATTAATLEGIVSKETQLSVLSIVDDVPAELQRIEDERAAELEAVSSYNNKEEDDDDNGGDNGDG